MGVKREGMRDTGLGVLGEGQGPRGTQKGAARKKVEQKIDPQVGQWATPPIQAGDVSVPEKLSRGALHVRHLAAWRGRPGPHEVCWAHPSSAVPSCPVAGSCGVSA